MSNPSACTFALQPILFVVGVLFFFFKPLNTVFTLSISANCLSGTMLHLGFVVLFSQSLHHRGMIVSVGQGIEEKVSLSSLSSELVFYSSGKKSVFHPPQVASTIEVVVCAVVSLPGLQSGFCGFQYHCNCRGQVHSWRDLTRVISGSVSFHTNLYCYVPIKLQLYSKCLALKLSSPRRLQLQPVICSLGIHVILKADWWELHGLQLVCKNISPLFFFSCLCVCIALLVCALL